MTTRLAHRFASWLLAAGLLVGLTACNNSDPTPDAGTPHAVLQVSVDQPVAAADIAASYDSNGMSFDGIVTPSDGMLGVPHDDGQGHVTVGVITTADVEGVLLELVFTRTADAATARIDNITLYDATGGTNDATYDVTRAPAPSARLHNASRAVAVLESQVHPATAGTP
jgi:hypothetical protein